MWAEIKICGTMHSHYWPWFIHNHYYQLLIINTKYTCLWILWIITRTEVSKLFEYLSNHWLIFKVTVPLSCPWMLRLGMCQDKHHSLSTNNNMNRQDWSMHRSPAGHNPYNLCFLTIDGWIFDWGTLCVRGSPEHVFWCF